MPVKEPKELFVALLSDVRQNTESASKIYLELGQHAQAPQVKEALIARAFISANALEKITLLESCLGEKLAFVERTRRLIQHIIETRAKQKRAA